MRIHMKILVTGGLGYIVNVNTKLGHYIGAKLGQY